MKTTRWRIIGCGDVTEVKSGPAFQKADRSHLTTVIRRSGELAMDYAQPVILTTARGQSVLEYEYPEHIQQPLIQNVVNSLNGEGTCPSTGERGARTSWVMGQMLNRNSFMSSRR